MLEELNISHQKLQNGMELAFEPSTLNTLSSNLTRLNMAVLILFHLLYFHPQDTIIRCSNNKIKNAGEVVEVLSGLKELEKAIFTSNPVQNYKYRETMLINCNSRLSYLDGKEIDRKQRDALMICKTQIK